MSNGLLLRFDLGVAADPSLFGKRVPSINIALRYESIKERVRFQFPYYRSTALRERRGKRISKLKQPPLAFFFDFVVFSLDSLRIAP